MSMLYEYINSIDLIVKLLTKALSKRFKKIAIGPLEFQLRTNAEETYEATFKKIETAQNNLSDAIETIDSLKNEYSEESRRLGKLLEDVKNKREEYQNTTQELNMLQQMTNKERDLLKLSLGFNDKRDKVVGFIAGVIASLVATALWVFIPKLWSFFFDIFNKAN